MRLERNSTCDGPKAKKLPGKVGIFHGPNPRGHDFSRVPIEDMRLERYYRKVVIRPIRRTARYVGPPLSGPYGVGDDNKSTGIKLVSEGRETCN